MKTRKLILLIMLFQTFVTCGQKNIKTDKTTMDTNELVLILKNPKWIVPANWNIYEFDVVKVEKGIFLGDFAFEDNKKIKICFGHETEKVFDRDNQIGNILLNLNESLKVTFVKTDKDFIQYDRFVDKNGDYWQLTNLEIVNHYIEQPIKTFKGKLFKIKSSRTETPPFASKTSYYLSINTSENYLIKPNDAITAEDLENHIDKTIFLRAVLYNDLQTASYLEPFSVVNESYAANLPSYDFELLVKRAKPFRTSEFKLDKKIQDFLNFEKVCQYIENKGEKTELNIKPVGKPKQRELFFRINYKTWTITYDKTREQIRFSKKDNYTLGFVRKRDKQVEVISLIKHKRQRATIHKEIEQVYGELIEHYVAKNYDFKGITVHDFEVAQVISNQIDARFLQGQTIKLLTEARNSLNAKQLLTLTENGGIASIYFYKDGVNEYPKSGDILKPLSGFIDKYDNRWSYNLVHPINEKRLLKIYPTLHELLENSQTISGKLMPTTEKSILQSKFRHRLNDLYLQTETKTTFLKFSRFSAKEYQLENDESKTVIVKGFRLWDMLDPENSSEVRIDNCFYVVQVQENKGFVHLVGEAQNAKLGAALYTENPWQLYYLKNKKQWGDEFVGKTISLIGKLQVVDNGELMFQSFPEAGVQGKRNFILNEPEYQIIDTTQPTDYLDSKYFDIVTKYVKKHGVSEEIKDFSDFVGYKYPTSNKVLAWNGWNLFVPDVENNHIMFLYRQDIGGCSISNVLGTVSTKFPKTNEQENQRKQRQILAAYRLLVAVALKK